MIWQTNTFQHEYTIKDHLGNARVTYSDGNNDGVITVADIKQINHYYPFGMNMEGNWNGAAGSNKYQYNQKEWNDDFGLGLNDYGARFYDPAIARWTAVDPLGEMRANVTPYQYVQNNPMNRIDPTGTLDESRGADGMTNSQWMNASNPNNYGAGLESNYRNQNRAEDIDKERKRDKLNKFVSDGLSDDDQGGGGGHSTPTTGSGYSGKYSSSASNPDFPHLPNDIHTNALLSNGGNSVPQVFDNFGIDIKSIVEYIKANPGGTLYLEIGIYGYSKEYTGLSFFNKAANKELKALKNDKAPKEIIEEYSKYIAYESSTRGYPRRLPIINYSQYYQIQKLLIKELEKNGIQQRAIVVPLIQGYNSFIFYKKPLPGVPRV